MEGTRKEPKDIIQASSLDDLHHCPVVLNEPGRCTMCRFSTLVLVQPDEICGKCWVARLDRTIERDYPASEATRIKAFVRAHVLL